MTHSERFEKKGREFKRALDKTTTRHQAKTEQLRQQLAGQKNIETMTEAIVCESSSISCMYGRCAECKEKEFPFTSGLGHEDPVSHVKWITKKNEEGCQVIVKETVESTFFDVVNLCQEKEFL